MAPAHGVEDYAAFLVNGLLDDASTSVVCPVDDTGRYNSEIVNLARNPDHGKRLTGQAVLGGGTDEILAVLNETGVLLADQRYKHRYPYDSRTNNPMIFRYASPGRHY
jgi:isoleucyl-tRNA synthetase